MSVVVPPHHISAKVLGLRGVVSWEVWASDYRRASGL